MDVTCINLPLHLFLSLSLLTLYGQPQGVRPFEHAKIAFQEQAMTEKNVFKLQSLLSNKLFLILASSTKLPNRSQNA